MNIGIFTFHRAHNYGAVLQAYALAKSLKKNGSEVCFIDYQHPKISEGYSFFPRLNFNLFRLMKSYVHLLLDPLRRYKRIRSFNRFIENNFQMIKVDTAPVHLDLLVLGSDQIWNPEYTDGFIGEHFGLFPKVVANKIISYAASMGKNELSTFELEVFLGMLEHIDKIGVREESLSRLISKYRCIPCVVNLDPTLLLTANEWDEIVCSPKIKQDYILVYEVHEHSDTQALTRMLQDYYGCDVVFLGARTNFRTPCNTVVDASPEEFLGYFKHAKFVLTTSFHGTVFSVINQKKFITLGFGNDVDVRSSEFLSDIGLADRKILGLSEFNYDLLQVDYSAVNQALSKIRTDSLEFLYEYVE